MENLTIYILVTYEVPSSRVTLLKKIIHVFLAPTNGGSYLEREWSGRREEEWKQGQEATFVSHKHFVAMSILEKYPL